MEFAIIHSDIRSTMSQSGIGLWSVLFGFFLLARSDIVQIFFHYSLTGSDRINSISLHILGLFSQWTRENKNDLSVFFNFQFICSFVASRSISYTNMTCNWLGCSNKTEYVKFIVCGKMTQVTTSIIFLHYIWGVDFLVFKIVRKRT